MSALNITRRQALLGMTALGATATFGMPAFAQNTKVNLGVLRLASHAPSFIAYERGYFAEAGLDIDMKYFEAAQAAAVGVASGDVDYCVSSITGGLISLAEKDAIKVIGGALSEDPEVDGALILASNQAFEAGLDHPSKIKGKSFGITTAGSSFHYMAHKIAQGNGFTLEDVTLRSLQKVGSVVGALTTGQVDAWAIQPSIGKKLVADGAAKQIGWVRDYAPHYQVTTVFTSTDLATNQRERTQAFLDALSRAVADYNAAFVDKTADEATVDELAKMVHKYVEADVPFETAKSNLVNGSQRINQDLKLAYDDVIEQLNWFKAEGMVKDTITEAQLFDTSYVEKI